MSESKEDRFFQTLREATSGREGEYESFTALLNQGDADTVQLLIHVVWFRKWWVMFTAA